MTGSLTDTTDREDLPVFTPIEGKSFISMLDPFGADYATLTIDRQIAGADYKGDMLAANLGLDPIGYQPGTFDVVVPADLTDLVFENICYDFIAQMTVVNGQIVMDGELAVVEIDGEYVHKLRKGNGELVALAS